MTPAREIAGNLLITAAALALAWLFSRRPRPGPGRYPIAPVPKPPAPKPPACPDWYSDLCRATPRG